MKKTYIGALASALALTSALALPAAAQNPAQNPAPAPAQNPVRLNRTIDTLAKGGSAFGLFTADFSPANARALARSNLDYLLIDMEHTAFNMETLQEFLLALTDKQAIAQRGDTQMRTTPFVRIPTNGRNDPEWIVKQVLDIGVFGIMFPYVENADEARRNVAAMRYPQPRGSTIPQPTGVRGSSPAVASWYWGVPGYTQRADVWPLNPQGELLAIMQIESLKGVENAEAIMTTPGVGAIFVGPSDLSMNMGLPSSHPEVAMVTAVVASGVCVGAAVGWAVGRAATDEGARVGAELVGTELGPAGADVAGSALGVVDAVGVPCVAIGPAPSPRACPSA